MHHARWFVPTAFALVLLASTTRADIPETTLHFALDRSDPAADSAVVAPARIQLWFTQAPQDGTTQIRVVDAGGALVPTSEVSPVQDQAFAFGVDVERVLTPGEYSVAWRAIAQDGHAVAEEFEFWVRVAD